MPRRSADPRPGGRGLGEPLTWDSSCWWTTPCGPARGSRSSTAWGCRLRSRWCSPRPKRPWSSFPSGSATPRRHPRRGRHRHACGAHRHSHRVAGSTWAACTTAPPLGAVALRLFDRRGAAQLKTSPPGESSHGPDVPTAAPCRSRLHVSLELQLLLLAWNARGLDLVSVPQAMIARPLVAGHCRRDAGDVATDLSSSVVRAVPVRHPADGRDPLPEYGPPRRGRECGARGGRTLGSGSARWWD